ncbi:unnamed protein product [Darwinula stevensoni]|uniref:GP-PDE domain-containing protein n=1 Tax=Darwinula stevensoni TaxID=69355 RepID=A0A7R9A8Q3_9CRUS|nr:unnamed protein product [Darwinula stevensoni]CAG0896631.1 unnamed protein product [Darwinula stevensoni]
MSGQMKGLNGAGTPSKDIHGLNDIWVVKMLDSIFQPIIFLWFCIWCFIVNFFVTLGDPFCLIVLFLLCAAIIYAAVAHLRIPPPSEEAVRSVLGPAFDEDEAENVMDVIGHRGACLDAPENSLSAFRKCKEQGVKGVELDICLSKDGVAYAFHDDTFDRLTEATGPVSSLTWSQVQELHIRPPPGHENEFEKEKIPSLAEALNTCLDLGLKVIIDVKYSTHQVRKEDPRIVFSMGFRPWYYSHRAFSGQQGPSSPRFRHFKHILAVGLDLIMHWALMHILVDFLGISAILFVKDALHSMKSPGGRQRA